MKRSDRKWWLRFAILIAAALLIYLIGRGGLLLWIESELSDDSPRIAFSLERSVLNELGITSATYEQAFARNNARLVPISNDDAQSAQDIEDFFKRERISGVLLSGGGDVDPAQYGAALEDVVLVDSARDEFELLLIKVARKQGMPILGICRGLQLINVAFGGTLQSIRSDSRLESAHFVLTGHSVELEPGTELASILKVERIDSVKSFHGQAIDQLAPDLRYSAKGPHGIIEAVELKKKERAIVLGVQWHPELTVIDDLQDDLLRAFIAAAGESR